MEDVWLDFKEGVIGALEVCGVRQSKGCRKRTRSCEAKENSISEMVAAEDRGSKRNISNC